MYDYLYKIVLVGNTAVGKSSVCHRLLENKFDKNYDMTIGVEFGSKILSVKDKKIKLQIWDTAGQEQFRSIVKSYYRNTAGALICFDITNKHSFDSLIDWIKEVKSYSEHTRIILVGTKKDMESKREISIQDAQDFADRYNMPYLEVSALHNENIQECFQLLAEKIFNYMTIYPYLIADTINETGIKRYIDSDPKKYIKLEKETKKTYCCYIL